MIAVEKLGAPSLLNLEVPTVQTGQLDLFSPDSIRAVNHGSFESAFAVNGLVMAVDLGGGSLTASVMTMEESGNLHSSGAVQHLEGVRDGHGYLETLERVARLAKARQLPVGLSFAGPVEGTKPLEGPNVSELIDDLNQKYDGDFANLFPSLVACENDAIAGLRTGVRHYSQNAHEVDDVIYLINGSGIGASVLSDGVVWATEAGHVELSPDLNPLYQQQPCDQFGNPFVCIERVAASKAGIENIWAQVGGVPLSGKQIEAEYKDGNGLAQDLYDNSALLTSHVVLGVAKALQMDLGGRRAAIVGHGGAFRFPDYGSRVQQIVSSYVGQELPIALTKDFVNPNACLDGAALAALAKIA